MKLLFLLFGLLTLLATRAMPEEPSGPKTSSDTPGYDTNDLDIPTKGDLQSGSKRNPTASDAPYSDDEMKKADTPSSAPANMPVDQD